MLTPKNLAVVSKTELLEFLNSFDNVFCDLDGVVFTLFEAIEGAFKSLNKLKQHGKTIRFLSNNCTQTIDNLVERITTCGFNAERGDIVLPTLAIIHYLQDINFQKRISVIGLSNLKKELSDAGFVISSNGTNYINETTDCILKEIADDLEIGAVIFDWDLNLNYMTLQKVLTYLKRPDVLFITISPIKQVPIGKERVLIGCGYFQDIISDISGRQPLMFGKPSEHLKEYVSRRFNLKPQRTLLIGDSFTDVLFAARSDYQTLMILNEKVTESDLLNNTITNVSPNYYLNSLGELCNLIDNVNINRDNV